MDTAYDIIQQSLVLKIGTELDHHETKNLKLLTDTSIRKNRIKNIIFDLSQTEFMDSAGIGLMISRYKEIDLQGGKLCVIHPTHSAKKLMKMSGLYHLLYEFETLEEALANV